MIVIPRDPPMAAEIAAAVATEFGLPLREMMSERRALRCARPRMVAMWIACETTGYSLPRIGRFFDRDHTTVMHARRAVEARRSADPAFAARVDALRRRFELDAFQRQSAGLLEGLTP